MPPNFKIKFAVMSFNMKLKNTALTCKPTNAIN